MVRYQWVGQSSITTTATSYLLLCTQTLGFSARRSYFGEQAVDFWTRLLELAILSLGYNVVGLVVGFVMMHPSRCQKKKTVAQMKSAVCKIQVCWLLADDVGVSMEVNK